jgi:membrane associated rhomboid family serine protease
MSIIAHFLIWGNTTNSAPCTTKTVITDWLLLQAFYIEFGSGDYGGVDYWAHVGGFGVGLMLIFLWVFME